MREIRRILADVPGLVVRDLDEVGVGWDPAEEDLEPHETFEANALSKARYFADRSGLATVADDSGIEVDALGGAPGVRTKRFAQDGGAAPPSLEGQALDDANNRHLVMRLASVPPEDRTARYVCVAVLVPPADPVVASRADPVVASTADPIGASSADPVVVRGEAPGVIVDTPAGSGGFGYDPHVFDPALGRTFAEMTPAEKDGRSHRGRAFRALAEVLRDAPAGGDY